MGRRSELTVVQRREIVLKMLRREEPANVLARHAGVSENTLYHWRDDFLAAGEAALGYGRGPGDGHVAQIKELQGQIAERDRLIGELTIANRVLKKTADGLI